ncbi:uncharacterized protein BDZ99DRAFT_88829 [Mytilinidion resinicola]|uniref:Uncharacterized protein n=1 Tax=Mytilinidion resinicola TaxID=574789 RepID=A0A6A6YED2_9PEZI|nr:uncharacterized protein BDZ99DRAFT_88829 [Mytilinidion resinicola]KAF2806959.1 hypothetical protein BDZ99DRAFT_88829 [Mytilinidion resinicola]
MPSNTSPSSLFWLNFRYCPSSTTASQCAPHTSCRNSLTWPAEGLRGGGVGRGEDLSGGGGVAHEEGFVVRHVLLACVEMVCGAGGGGGGLGEAGGEPLLETAFLFGPVVAEEEDVFFRDLRRKVLGVLQLGGRRRGGYRRASGGLCRRLRRRDGGWWTWVVVFWGVRCLGCWEILR